MTRSAPRAVRMGLLWTVVALGFGLAVGFARTEKKPEGHQGGHAAKAEHAQTEGAPAMPGMQGMAEGEVMVDPRRQQLIGVTYGKVERRDAEQVIRTVGTIAYDESLLSDVTLKFHG